MTTTTTAPGTVAGPTRPTMAECMDQLTGHDELEIEKRYGLIIELLQGSKYMRALAFSQELHAGLDAGKAYKKITDLTQLELAEYFTAPPDDDDDGDDAGDPDGKEGSDDDPAQGTDGAGSADGPGSPGPGSGRRPVVDSPQA